MNTYVLVHGSWHGAWCWEKIIPLIEQGPDKVITLDLPAHGSDLTPATSVSLHSYADAICGVLDEQPEPVILVGHSMGGIAIAQAAEYRPQKIKALVFLAAFLLRDGESLSDLARQDEDSLVNPNLIVNQAEGVLNLREEGIVAAFYEGCSDEDAARAKTLLCPDPLAPQATPLKLSAENFGQVPRFYVECTHDRAITPALQKQMYTATPCRKVFSLEADHSPFYSAPVELVGMLEAVGSRNLASCS